MNCLTENEDGFFKYNGCLITIDGIGMSHFAGQETKPPKREEVEICKEWIKVWIDTRKTINRRHSSYFLKHCVEKFHAHVKGRDDVYVSNGAFIQAALELGYHVEPCCAGSINAIFNMSYKRIDRHRNDNNICIC